MYTTPVHTPKDPALYTPWFAVKEDGNPVRPGIYQVANKGVSQISENHPTYQGKPYGWTYQYWDGKNWQQYGGWGFYGRDSYKWRGRLKGD